MDLQRTDTSVFDLAHTEREASARLFIEQTGRPPRIVAIAAGAEVRLGRDPHLEVALDDTRASRLHAVVAFDGRAVTVRDEGSSNGTFVAGATTSLPLPVSPWRSTGSSLAASLRTSAKSATLAGSTATMSPPLADGPITGPCVSGRARRRADTTTYVSPV